MSDNMMDERKEITCRDCGAKEGQLHQLGCDMEKCPFCGNQLISCDCLYEKLGLCDHEKYTNETAFLPPEIYSNGPDEAQWDQFEKMLNEKGRFPYIRYPVLCSLCGDLWPDLFHVPKDEWERYIEPRMQRTVICRPCYDYIVEVTNWQTAVAFVNAQMSSGVAIQPETPVVWSDHLHIPVEAIEKAIAERIQKGGEHHG